MKNLKLLKEALINKTPLVWNDPDPITGADYRITHIEDVDAFIKLSEQCNMSEEEEQDFIITIQYGKNSSEAEVFLNEISDKKQKQMRRIMELRIDYIEDDTNRQYVDVWFTEDDNEEGKSIAYVDLNTNNTTYLDDAFRANKEVTKAIEDIKKVNKIKHTS